MATKIIANETRETLKTAAERNGFTDDKGKASVAELKTALNDEIGAIRTAQIDEAGLFFENTFQRTMQAMNALQERLAKCDIEQAAQVVSAYLKSGFDSQVLEACVTAVKFGIKSTVELKSYVTSYTEYSDVIKRMKWLVNARKLVLMTFKANGLNKEQLSEGLAYLKGKLNSTENQAHAYKQANFFILQALGLEFKGIQTADRLDKSIEYLNNVFAKKDGLVWSTQQFAGIFGINVELAVEETTETDSTSEATTSETPVETPRTGRAKRAS